MRASGKQKTESIDKKVESWKLKTESMFTQAVQQRKIVEKKILKRIDYFVNHIMKLYNEIFLALWRRVYNEPQMCSTKKRYLQSDICSL